MDNDQMAKRIREVFESGDLEKMAKAQHEMQAENVVMEWPQSGELIRGRENVSAINRNYPASTGTTIRSPACSTSQSPRRRLSVPSR